MAADQHVYRRQEGSGQGSGGSRERRVGHDRLSPWYTAVTRRGRPSCPGWPYRCQRLPNLSGASSARCAHISHSGAGLSIRHPRTAVTTRPARFEGTPKPWVRAVTSPSATGRRAGRLRITLHEQTLTLIPPSETRPAPVFTPTPPFGTWRCLGLDSGACPMPVLGAAQADRRTGWCRETSLRRSVGRNLGDRLLCEPFGWTSGAGHGQRLQCRAGRGRAPCRRRVSST